LVLARPNRHCEERSDEAIQCARKRANQNASSQPALFLRACRREAGLLRHSRSKNGVASLAYGSQ